MASGSVTCSGAYLLLSLLVMLWTAVLSLSQLTVEANAVVANPGSVSMTEMSHRRLTRLKLVLFFRPSMGSLLRLIRPKLRGICLSSSDHSLSFHFTLWCSPSCCWSLFLSLSPSLANKHVSSRDSALTQTHSHTHFYMWTDTHTHTHAVQTGST